MARRYRVRLFSVRFFSRAVVFSQEGEWAQVPIPVTVLASAIVDALTCPSACVSREWSPYSYYAAP